MRTLGLVLAAATIAPPAFAWEPTGPALQTLSSGQAWAEVQGEAQGAGLIHAAVDIPAPPKLVWAVMTDCREMPKLIANGDPCRVLSADPGGTWDVREQVTHGNLIMPPIRNVYRSDYEPYTVIRFHRLSGDLRIEDGVWRFEPLNGGRGTRVIYENLVAANIPAPSMLVRQALRSDTPKVLMNLRRECAARVGQ
ncbi:MAG TPA: SRPBCC family protein [Caulobacteraceae bacterium]